MLGGSKSPSWRVRGAEKLFVSPQPRENSVLFEKQFPAVPEGRDADELGVLDVFELHAVARRQDAALEA